MTAPLEGGFGDATLSVASFFLYNVCHFVKTHAEGISLLFNPVCHLVKTHAEGISLYLTIICKILSRRFVM